MKQKLTAILTLPILLALPTDRGYAAGDVGMTLKCSNDARCTNYVASTYSYGGTKEPTTTLCDTNTYGYCWLWGDLCVSNGFGNDTPGYCTQRCAEQGYDILVYDMNNNYEWGCACVRDTSFQEWQKYSTRRMQKYTPTYRNDMTAGKCTVTATPTGEYRCAAGYYGTATSEATCYTCPTNATCSGGTTFMCNNGYYKNAAKTGCTKCPDSKTAGLGWDANGNGVAAVGGGDDIGWCAIASGTVLHDNTGTFIVDPDNELSDGCEY
ncbi:MAG: hypothetical protein K2L94_01565 [Alphaproteobacteria bacterium]|nr:hypothetical protein [Alphaproteobacteria bacterium]